MACRGGGQGGNDVISSFLLLYVARSREKRYVSIFSRKNQWSLPNIEDSSNHTAFTMILVMPPHRHNGRYLMA
jgi:hypothetical protein